MKWLIAHWPFVLRKDHQRLWRYAIELEDRCLLLRRHELMAADFKVSPDTYVKAQAEEQDFHRRLWAMTESEPF